MSFFLKISIDVDVFNSIGREFHKRGAATEKARVSHQSHQGVGRSKTLEDRTARINCRLLARTAELALSSDSTCLLSHVTSDCMQIRGRI